MLHVVLGLLLLALVVGGAVSVLSRVVSAAFPHGSSSSRGTGSGRGSKALRSPASRSVRTAGRSAASAAAHPTNRQIRAQAKADTGRAWTDVKATDWLEQRRHDRANGTAGGGGTDTAVKPTLSQRLRLRPFTPTDAAGANGNGQNGSTNGTSQPNGTNGKNGTNGSAPPPQATTPPARPASTNGGTPVAGTSTASAEKLIEGINEIYAHAATGGINAKQEAIKAAHEACVRFASMALMLNRTMSEPDHNYGPEITEPIAKAGQHLQAGAMSWAEADAAITTLKNMTVGDLAKSPRQAPHHRELSENGSR